MKTLFCSTVLTTLALAAGAPAQLLFSDNFTVSAQSFDINLEIANGRQSGVFAPIHYLDTDSGGGGFRTQVGESTFPNALFLFPEAGASQQYASPNFNFNTSGAQLSISVLARNQSSMQGADLIGFDIGANGALDAPFAGSGFGLVLRPHFTGILGQNNFEIYEGGSLLASGNSPAVLPNSNQLAVTLNGAAFDGTPVAVNLTVNGTSIFASTLPAGFTNNFVTVGAASFSGDGEFYGFDNLAVQVVPEPSTALALIGGGGLLLGLRRRR